MGKIKEIGNPLNLITKTAKKGGTLLIHHSEHLGNLIKTRLWLKVLIALFLGSVFGLIMGPDANLVTRELAKTITDWFALPGNIFLELIKMVIFPLIFSSIILGIISSGDKSFLKNIAPKVVTFFVIVTVIGIFIGLGTTHLIQPGKHIDLEAIQTNTTQVGSLEDSTVPDRIIGLFPSNPLKSAVSGDMLGIVIFTVIIGIGLLSVNKEHLAVAKNLLETLQSVSMIVVKWAMHLVPYAVFGLIAQSISKIGFNALKGLGLYIVTVIVALFILLIVFLIIVSLYKNPFRFLNDIKEVILLAFSTSSSAAAMPLSMKIAKTKLKIKRHLYEFIIPVGATIDMAGTALYQAVATIFLAQAFGVSLSVYSLVLIIIITVGASIGSPAVPGVGIVILATILVSVGIPETGIALILGVDRLLDMFRTSLNVTGDLTACVVFNKR